MPTMAQPGEVLSRPIGRALEGEGLCLLRFLAPEATALAVEGSGKNGCQVSR
jgi:hypothetical protein